MKKNKFPTITVRVTDKQRDMIDVLKSNHYVNISKMFRDFIEKIYKEKVDESPK